MSRLLLLVLLAALPSYAADVYSVRDQSGNAIRLFDTPCKVAAPWMNLKKAEVFYGGKLFEACWIALGRYVLVLDSNGDATPISVASFKKEEGA